MCSNITHYFSVLSVYSPGWDRSITTIATDPKGKGNLLALLIYFFRGDFVFPASSPGDGFCLPCPEWPCCFILGSICMWASDSSLAPCTVWDETLPSPERGAGVAPVERMEPNYRTVCCLLWEPAEGGEEGEGSRMPYDRKEKQNIILMPIRAWKHESPQPTAPPKTRQQPPEREMSGAQTEINWVTGLE